MSGQIERGMTMKRWLSMLLVLCMVWIMIVPALAESVLNTEEAESVGTVTEEKEVLEENPRYAYLVGMLDVQSDDEDYSGAGEQEVDADMAFEDG